MPFFLLLLLALLSLQAQWPEPPSWCGWWGSLLTPLAGLLVLWASAAWLARRQAASLLRNPGDRNALMRRYQRQRRRHVLALTAFYLITLFFLGWGWCVRFIWNDLPGVELLLLAPFVAGLALLWSRYYDVDRTTHHLATNPEKPPFPTRAAYVGLQARHHLLLVVPVLVLSLLQETLFLIWPSVRDTVEAQALLAVGLFSFALLSLPFLLKRFLGLASLPDGPLRQRLLAAAGRLKLRFRDILLWPTRGTIANAMVTGVLPWNRYIVVTDRLLQELTPDEVEAVFGHEVGHVKHHHLWCYIVFILASVGALVGLGQAAGGLAELWNLKALVSEDWWQSLQFFGAVPTLVGFALYMFVVFGYLSRRCERQADLFGCRATNTATFVSALEKVADANGMPRDKPGWFSCWLHGSIGQRINILQKMLAQPHLEPQFQTRVRLLKWGLPGSLVFLTVALALFNSNAWVGILKWMNPGGDRSSRHVRQDVRPLGNHRDLG
jgi:Zn-dependent protease with chaperone function